MCESRRVCETFHSASPSFSGELEFSSHGCFISERYPESGYAPTRIITPQ